MLAFVSPTIDWHAFAPELVLTGVVCVLLLADIIMLERARPIMSSLAGLGLLAALIPVLTLAVSDEGTRTMFGDSFVVDDTALLLKALFLISGYIVVLLSTNYVAEGDYWESEYYTLMLASLLGMSVMASARDLITIFVALELLSIPAYMLAGWRKRDVKSNEAGMKYFLMGVFASAVLLYGMSLLYGLTGSTNMFEIGQAISGDGANTPALSLAIIFTLVGFAFKVSAVPFHQWAPDTYEGAPTPVTAFLAVLSKSAGFVAIIQVLSYSLEAQPDVVVPLMFVLAALSMTIGNLIALKQTNVVRMLAYSGIAQAGFMLAPFAVVNQAGVESEVYSSVITYLAIYAAMNLGAFAVVLAVARKTRSAEIESWGGAFQYAPGLTVAMTVFLASFIGIPPLGGWYAKFGVSKVLIGAETGWGYGLAIILAINTAVAAFYYLNIARVMWFEPVTDGDTSEISVPPSLKTAIGICLVATLIFGILPGFLADAADFAPAVAIGI